MTVCSVCLLVEEVCSRAALPRGPAETVALTEALQRLLERCGALGVGWRTR